MGLCLQCSQSTNNPKFCSRHCSTIYNNIKHPKRSLQNKCKLCESKTLTNRKYCKSCWDQYKSSIVAKNNNRNYKPVINKICLACNQPFSQYGSKCCSPKCGDQWKFLQMIQKVEAAGRFRDTSNFNTAGSFIKRYLKFKYGDKCSICNQSNMWNNKPITLIVDHTNGKPNDWTISNIRLVCPNCNSQLPTFCARNRKNGGRPNRYYKQAAEQGI